MIASINFKLSQGTVYEKNCLIKVKVRACTSGLWFQAWALYLSFRTCSDFNINNYINNY